MKLLRDIGRQLRSWWRRDRIRTSPREGEPLRVQPGDLLTVAGVTAEVTSRQVEELPNGTRIHLECGAAMAIDLELVAEGTITRMVWSAENTSRELTPADLEIWPRG